MWFQRQQRIKSKRCLTEFDSLVWYFVLKGLVFCSERKYFDSLYQSGTRFSSVIVIDAVCMSLIFSKENEHCQIKTLEFPCRGQCK